MSINFIDWNIKGGSHVPFLDGKLFKTILYANFHGMSSCQFFLGNPQSFKRSKIDEEDMKLSQYLQDRFDIKCFSHAPYVYNLCGSKKSLAWNGNTEQDSKTSLIIKSLEYELEIMSKINGGVVIHPGSYSDTKKGIETIVKSLDKIEFKDGYNLLLENCAGQGDTLARNFEELYGMLSSKNSKNINVCIDTAHIWGVGEYDISTEKGVEKLFTEFDKIIGLEKFKLLHLNDSRVNISSRKDCHEEIKNGYIWKTNDSSLKYLLHKVENLNIPFVLETTQDDFIKVYDLYRKLKD